MEFNIDQELKDAIRDFNEKQALAEQARGKVLYLQTLVARANEEQQKLSNLSQSDNQEG